MIKRSKGGFSAIIPCATSGYRIIVKKLLIIEKALGWSGLNFSFDMGSEASTECGVWGSDQR